MTKDAMRKNTGFYLNAKQLAEMQGCSPHHIRDIFKEIEVQIDAGRYSRYGLLDGMVNIYVFYDYLKYRKLLKNPVSAKYVPRFDPDELAELCPVVERFFV